MEVDTINNDNTYKLFYFIIGIATMLTTITGVTFSYFSSSVSSANDAASSGSGDVGLSISTVLTGVKNNLIPVDATDSHFNSYPGDDQNDCQDLNNNNICSVYTFTISNAAEALNQNISVTLTPTVNTFQNLHFAIFKGTASNVAATQNMFDVDGVATSTVINADKHIIGNNGDLVLSDTAFTLNSHTAISLPALEQALYGGDSVTYTIILWIQNVNSNQVDSDAAKEFSAILNVNNANGNGVSAMLSTH